METAVLLERHVRFEPFELNLRTRELHGNGLRRKLRGQPTLALRARQAHDFLLALSEALTLDSLPQETTHD